MKNIQTVIKLFAAIAITALFTSCVTSDMAQIDGSVAINAGFKTITATTPEQIATLAKMPAAQVSSLTHKGKKYYVLPSGVKNQAYVGGPKQYKRYQELQATNQVSNANLEALELSGTGYDDIGAGSLAAWDGWGDWAGTPWY